MLAEAVAAAPARRLTVLDLSVPRNVEPSARAVPGVRLFDLDDLQQLRCPAGGFARPPSRTPSGCSRRRSSGCSAPWKRAGRPRAWPSCTGSGASWPRRSRRGRSDELGDLSERERQVVREMAERLVRRVLYPVSRALRDERAHGARAGTRAGVAPRPLRVRV